jgi:feruloyl esterase
MLDGFMRNLVAQDASADPLTIEPEGHLPRLDYLSDLLDAVDPDL